MNRTTPLIVLRYQRLADRHVFVYRFRPSDIPAGCGGPLFDHLFSQHLKGEISEAEMYEVCWAARQVGKVGA